MLGILVPGKMVLILKGPSEADSIPLVKCFLYNCRSVLISKLARRAYNYMFILSAAQLKWYVSWNKTWNKLFFSLHVSHFSCAWCHWILNAFQGPLYQHGLTLTPAWISNYIHYKAWDEIIHPFPNFNGCTVEVWELISNCTPRSTVHMITYPCWDWS